MQLRLKNGAKFDPQNSKGLETVDDNIVRHTGMHRLASKEPTPFQLLLNTIKENNYKLTKKQLDVLIDKILRLPTNEDIAQGMFSPDDGDIIDAYNDNCRRFFDSILTKKILNISTIRQFPSATAALY